MQARMVPLLLALDLSTKPGWAVFRFKQLSSYGTLFATKTVEDFGLYPFNYLELAEHTIRELFENIISPLGPALTIVLEETTASKANYSQKKLEFLHLQLLQKCKQAGLSDLHYVRDGIWKNAVGARQNAAEKKLNAQIARYKKKNKSKLAKLDLDGDGRAEVVGRRGQKHYSVRAVREHFGIMLAQKDEDAAEAILIGKAFLQGIPACDGTDRGGLLPKA
jgi:hypothetical protein